MSVGSGRSTLCASANEELGTLADNNPLTGYEPNVLDNYQISETTEIFIQESSSNSRPSNLHDWKISDYTISMIKAAGNTELCELLDVEPKAQCKVCLSYWDVGIVYCTCGHFLRDGTEENKRFVKYTLDLFSIPNYYIKKGRPHGHLYGKKQGVLHPEFAQEEMQEKRFVGYSRPVHP